MGKIISFGKGRPIVRFLEEMVMTRHLLLNGKLDEVLIIAVGKDLKYCTANGIMFSRAKEMCKDFMENPKEYVE